MSEPIFLIKDNGGIIPLKEEPYKEEAIFQELLGKFPELLLINDEEQINSRLLLIRREAGIPIDSNDIPWFSLDHLFIDQEGIPTLVEVKRSSDSRLRREVIAQMLDYAANGVAFWTIEKIQDMLERTCREKGISSDIVLSEFLGDSCSPEEFWTNVRTNLAAGKIRMILVSNEIPKETRRIIEYLNEQMDTVEFLGIEIHQYIGGGITTMVPRMVGQTTRAELKKAIPQGPGETEESILEEMRKTRPAGEVSVALKIIEWMKSNQLDINFGKKSILPSFKHKGLKHYPILLYASGKLLIDFRDMKSPFDTEEKRLELFNLFTSNGISLPTGSHNKQPRVDLVVLEDQNKLDKFLQILTNYVNESRKG